jgi:gamma-glutamylcyclotransferase (GGCT)/AIG2-like uncharacterized protein YtfP
MPHLFSYGTLQQDDVQVATFGRLLRGTADALAEYEPALVAIAEAQLAASAGRTHHANVRFNGKPDSQVRGTVYEVTEAELAAADEFERPAEYVRVTVTLLSGTGAFVYVHGPTAFRDAVQRGDVAAVVRLLEQQPGLARVTDEHGKTGLHLAAESDRAEVAARLLDAGADLDARTVWDASALDWAAVFGSRVVGDLLLSRGARGLTLAAAAGLGKLEWVRAAFADGFDPSGYRRRGAPSQPDDHWPADSAHIKGDVISDAMYAAARNGHSAVVEYLLGRGADVDAKGVFGATALHWAALGGHDATIQTLLAHGASTGIRDARFEATAAQWASEGGHAQLADFLRRHRGA